VTLSRHPLRNASRQSTSVARKKATLSHKGVVLLFQLLLRLLLEKMAPLAPTKMENFLSQIEWNIVSFKKMFLIMRRYFFYS
jgi:hypothetical protein